MGIDKDIWKEKIIRTKELIKKHENEIRRLENKLLGQRLALYADSTKPSILFIIFWYDDYFLKKIDVNNAKFKFETISNLDPTNEYVKAIERVKNEVKRNKHNVVYVKFVERSGGFRTASSTGNFEDIYTVNDFIYKLDNGFFKKPFDALDDELADNY